MRVIVTGGAGFIGSHLCESLIRDGHACVGLDNFDPFYPREIKEENLAALSGHPRFKLVEGDIRNAGDIDAAFHAMKSLTPENADGGDMVMHLAALAGVRPSIKNPEKYQDVNVGGTTQILEAMRRHDVKKLVFASSSSVYGNNKKVPFSEDDRVDFPISPYAATKKACELIAHTYHHLFQMDITALRFFTVYGPRQRPDLAIHKFTKLLADGKSIPVFGDGTTSRDYTYIDDIIQGVRAAMGKAEGFHIYNLGESQTITLSELIETIAGALGVTPDIDRQPQQPGDVDCTFADISRARAELGYAPTTKIRDGIPAFVNWFRTRSAATAPAEQA